MNRTCWLTIVGLGEDGPEGLSRASLEALESADVVMGAARHLDLLPDLKAETIEWPVPFADGLPLLMGMRGKPVVVLASGDPFWFGAGSVIARDLESEEWRAIPGNSIFSLVAARLGWPLDKTACLGLHAAPVERLRPEVTDGARAIVLLRDGRAVAELAAWLEDIGFGASSMNVLESVGGPRERIRSVIANAYDLTDVQHPVCVAVAFSGQGVPITRAAGRDDDLFEHDGQITKRPVRALTLSALAPRRGERLWDIGSGSGSIAIEWLLADASCEAIAVEAREDRAARIVQNANNLGQDRLVVVHGSAPNALQQLARPDAVFVGGGLSAELLAWLEDNLAPGTRLVANAVTLETEALLVDAQARLGGSLLRVEILEVAPLGRFRGWKAAFPIVQWSVTL